MTGGSLFYGQLLDCPNEWLTEWHSCPQCDVALVYCDCENAGQLIDDLIYLYQKRRDYQEGAPLRREV